MKNISYALSGVLAIAVIILFVLVFDLKKGGQDAESKSGTEVPEVLGATLPIAYVNIDSLIANYEFAKEASNKLFNKFKASNNSVTQKQKNFEKEVAEFQRKLQQNAFLSQERAEQESQRLQKMEMNLEQMAQRLQNELEGEQMKMNDAITDSVRVCLEDYNRTAKYELILSNKGMDNILIANKKYDITAEILTLINERYKSGKSGKSK